MQVISKTFGTGTVISQDATSVKVDFNGQIKNLALRFANLTNEDGTPFFVAPIAAKVNKPKKSALPKVDYLKYSDAELIQMHNELMGEFVSAKSEARKDGRTGTKF